MQRFGETVHLGEVRAAIAHETPSSPEPTYREPPPDDAQLMFFVPTVHDAPLKDDINLMDIAPFSLSKNIRQGIIRYELKDAIITIEGGAEVGLVTAYDYDIFIHMVTHLAATMREYRLAEKRGLRPSLPPRTYRPSAAEILKFCRRDQGGRQYEQLEGSLDRLQATRYKITNLTHNNTRRASEAFPLIGRYKVVSRTQRNKIDQVEIDIPDWVYKGVVTPDEAPSILTLNTNYFLISRPHRALHLPPCAQGHRYQRHRRLRTGEPSTPDLDPQCRSRSSATPSTRSSRQPRWIRSPTTTLNFCPRNPAKSCA